ncbi:hypothetical protein Rumeso_03122 [Rubellimicrobium mesophilum DSM 19309]|uniref:Uncharacterized protein n=1 Tax=Rubellimicrobium mesophilum DSM 19309 TaxID=442562 RepID=A0A017HMA2_9RHOB|nr:hypothetical protein Rumeso_03122 [Rubellimicrobium mesophilum DSM 19309]
MHTHLENVGAPHTDDENVHSEELETLVDAREIPLVAADAIERFYNHNIEAASLGVCHKVGETFTADERGRGPSAIGVGLDDAQAFADGVGPAKLKLILDGAVRLEVSRVAGVQGRATANGRFWHGKAPEDSAAVSARAWARAKASTKRRSSGSGGRSERRNAVSTIRTHWAACHQSHHRRRATDRYCPAATSPVPPWRCGLPPGRSAAPHSGSDDR